MNCKQVHDNIEGYYEGVLPVVDELGIDIHLVQCPKCQSELGGVYDVVHECHDAFSELPNESDFENIQQGIQLMNQQLLDTEADRTRFFKKEQVLRLILIGIAIPTLFLLGNKAINTYIAYDSQYESTQQHYQELETVPNYISRDSVELDW